MKDEELILGKGQMLSPTNKAEDLLPKEEIDRRIDLLKSQNFYKCNSYFPELGSKSSEDRLLDLERQIRLYGYPDFQYLLFGMDVKTQAEQDSYVNSWEFICRRNYLNLYQNNSNSTCILRNKFYFGIFANAIGIKTPENVGYIENGIIHNIKDKFAAISLSDLLNICPDGFCKSLDGENGEDVFHLESIGDKIILSGKEISESELMEKLSTGTFLVQKKIYQHDVLNELYPLSINTLRIVTVRSIKTGEIKIWPSMFRMGANGSHIDNASKGGVVVNINLETGGISPVGYRYAKYGGRYTKHPDTGVDFSTFIIPHFDQVKRDAIYFHSMLKDIHSIGWDIAITPEGPAFIEGNDDWSIVQSQLDCGVRALYEEDFF
mgnify:FL=1